MSRADLRIRVDDAGCLEVVDPGYDTLDLLQVIDPAFAVRTAPLPGFSSPRLLKTRNAGCGLPLAALPHVSNEELWTRHDKSVGCLRTGAFTTQRQDEASILDLKTELARRLLENCHLCAHRCGVDRTRGERGVCRLGMEAVVAEHFVHIAEEPPINPSLVLNLSGCGLRCRGCQQWAILDPKKVAGVSLVPALWTELHLEGARSLSFVGGNPDESLHAALAFLAAAPEDWLFPVVWNTHAYSTPEALALLDGIVDAYVPDFKHANETCARRYARIGNYPETAASAIKLMLAQAVPVIVRLLLLPGHTDCCHLPALDWLAGMNDENLFVSIRDQYCPDGQVTEQDGALARRTSRSETAPVWRRAEVHGLRMVE